MQLSPVVRGVADHGVEYPPEFDDYGFTACKFACQKWNVEIEVFVVYLFEYSSADDLVEVFEIHNKTGRRIGLSANSYREIEIVSMPVFIGTGSEHLLILFFGPFRIV